MSRRYVYNTQMKCPLNCAGCLFTGFLRDSRLPSADELARRKYTEIVVPCHNLNLAPPKSTVKTRWTIQMRASVFSLIGVTLKAIWLRQPSFIFLWNTEPLYKFIFARFLNWLLTQSEIVLGLETVDDCKKIKYSFLRGLKVQVLPAILFEKLTHSQLSRLNELVRSIGADKIEGLRFWDLHEPRSPLRVPREPEFEIVSQKIHSQSRLDVSIIIPVYNDAEALLTTLKYWSQQKNRSFEIIIVDDGSTDHPWPTCQKFLATNPFYYRWVALERHAPRIRGDYSFRAGIARNVGVYNATGEILIFSDSDILVPDDAVDIVKKSSAPKMLLQAKRWQLKKNAHSGADNYNQLKTKTEYSASGYWENFQNSQTPWDQTPSKWKYVSTFFLSMLRQDFVNLGWFRKNYIHYGCEDTDLGVRALHEKFNFKLLDLDVLHVCPPTERSEYQLDAQVKKNILTSAYIQLYRNTLYSAVFEELIDTHLERDIMV